MWKMSFLKKIIKKNVHKQKFRGLVVFLSRLDGFEITCTSFRKNALKTLIFAKNLSFAFLNPKLVKLEKNSLKAPLNLSPLKCTYLGKSSFQ